MPQDARRGDRRRIGGRGSAPNIRYGIICGLIVAIVAISLGPARARSATPQRACDLYRQLDRRCACAGADNYLRAYGQKYCERFLASTGWSRAGLQWRDRTLTCLKNELRRYVARARGCDCAAIRAVAFESHARCYTRKAGSVCRLPLSDLGRITRIVDAADAIHGSPQTLAITLACVWQNGNAEARPDRPIP
jgi:hypothetical protein